MIAAVDTLPLVVAERVQSEGWALINQFDRALAQMPQQEMPLDHLFTPGMYVRQIFMPRGTLLTTRIHLTEHPFAVMSGAIAILSGDRKPMMLQAPFIGVTHPGTRRVIYCAEDCIFATFHATVETDPDKLVDLLTFDPIDLGHLDDLAPEQIAAIRACAKPTTKIP